MFQCQIRRAEVRDAVRHVQIAYPSKHPGSQAWVVVGNNGVAAVVDLPLCKVVTVYRVARPLLPIGAS